MANATFLCPRVPCSLWTLRLILPFPQALTWTDVPPHMPVFHPSSGAGSSRHELGLAAMSGERGLPVSTCSIPWKPPKCYEESSLQQSSGCRSPHGERGHFHNFTVQGPSIYICPGFLLQ